MSRHAPLTIVVIATVTSVDDCNVGTVGAEGRVEPEAVEAMGFRIWKASSAV